MGVSTYFGLLLAAFLIGLDLCKIARAIDGLAAAVREHTKAVKQ